MHGTGIPSAVALTNHTVLFIDQHNLRLVLLAFFFGVLSIATDDDEITNMHESRGSTVELFALAACVEVTGTDGWGMILMSTFLTFRAMN